MGAKNGQYRDVKDLEVTEDERARRIKAYSKVTPSSLHRAQSGCPSSSTRID
jgi:hypothetical protein